MTKKYEYDIRIPSRDNGNFLAVKYEFSEWYSTSSSSVIDDVILVKMILFHIIGNVI